MAKLDKEIAPKIRFRSWNNGMGREKWKQGWVSHSNHQHTTR